MPRSIKLYSRHHRKVKGKINKLTVARSKVGYFTQSSPVSSVPNNPTYKSLSELENRGVLFPMVQVLVRNAVSEQVQEAKDLNLPVSYTKSNGDIVVRYGHGEVQVIGNIRRSSLSSKQLTNGTVLHAKKR